MSRRPVVTLAVGLVAVALAVTGRAGGQAPAGKDATVTVAVPAQDFPKVHADLDDGSGPIRVMVGAATGIDVSGWTREARLHLRGVVGQRDSSGSGTAGYRVQPRDAADILAVTPPSLIKTVVAVGLAYVPILARLSRAVVTKAT